MGTGFAVRLDTVEPVHHLVGLAVRAERLGATAVLVGDGGRDVFVAVAAMAVATDRLTLLPLSTATTAAGARRAGPALASLDELSDGRVVGCFPAAALRAGPVVDTPHARIERDRVVALDGSWSIVAHRLERYDVEELAEIAARMRVPSDTGGQECGAGPGLEPPPPAGAGSRSHP